MRIGIIVQARMNSSRLPGKMLKEAEGKPLVWYVFSSLDQCREVDLAILSTSDLESDQPLADYAATHKIPIFRGPLEDVSSRFLETVKEFELDGFVRICGDSPLVDHRIIDAAVKIFKTGKYDLVSNVIKRSYPKGQSVEVVSSKIYKEIMSDTLTEHEKEHVTVKLYENLESLKYFSMESIDNHGEVQLSVDTEDDFISFDRMVNKMENPHWEYKWTEKLNMLERDI
ncbi:MAG: hypothetical protein BA863_18785 [Desulfovibrio sp. S3730MH75]|nr:MAG: hypothetical protein BA863_18785 [Desulfovibrio sp. S3730MH75]